MRFWLAAAVLASPAAAQQGTAADEAAAIKAAGERGALLFGYDRAAWLGTDDLLAKLPDATARIGGYIADGPREAPRLVFFDRAAVPQAIYVAQFRPGAKPEGKVLGAGDDRTLSALDLRLVAARTAAAAALRRDPDARPCAAKPFNTVVLPPETPAASTRVYFLTPQETDAAVPFGGHYLVEIDAAGQAGAVQRFTKSCLAVPTHPTVPAGGKPVAAFVSQLIGTTPTEIHVFASYVLHQPVYVATGGPAQRLWQVAGSRITAMPAPKR